LRTKTGPCMSEIMAEEKCYFCGAVHGDECPEFKDPPKNVEEHFRDYVEKTRIWACRCKTTITATVPEAVEKDWLVYEKSGVVWAICPACSLSEHATFGADIAEWRRKGSPRGDN
jgi:hypothetical protein